MFDTHLDVAHALGLELDPKSPNGEGPYHVRGVGTPFVIHGVLEGQPVRLVQGATEIVTTSPLAPALDLGLELRREGVVSAIAELFGARDVQIGDPSFDAKWAIRAEEPERVKALLQPALRATLSALEVGGVRLTDTEIRSALLPWQQDKRHIEAALRESVRIAHAVDAARSEVPVAASLRHHHAAWAAFAERHRLVIHTAPLAIHGLIGRTVVSAITRRKSATETEVVLSVLAEQSLGSGLAGMPRRSSVDRALSPTPTPVLATGDPSFDERFEVVASDPRRAVEALSAVMRNALVELANLGYVSFDDTSVRLTTDIRRLAPPTSIDVVERLRSIVESRFQPTLLYR